MQDNPVAYSPEDITAVSRYLVSLVESDHSEHHDALLAVLDGDARKRLLALAHLTAGLLIESDTPAEDVLAAVFDLAGRMGDLVAGESEG